MKHSHVLSLMQEGYTTCKIVYDSGGNEYTFKCRKGEVSEGALVVVESNYKFGYTVALVTQVHEVAQIDTSANYDYKWIVSKVDTEGYTARKDKEARLLAKLAEVEKVAVARRVIAEFKAQFADDAETLALIKEIGADAQQVIGAKDSDL